jgi:RHS repeat-associated protein
MPTSPFSTKRSPIRGPFVAAVILGVAAIPRPSSAAAPPPVDLGSGGPGTLAAPIAPAGDPTSRGQVDLATGTATSEYTFTLETARGDAQPRLPLQYNSSNGVGFAGVGWTLSLPVIVRKGAAGLPRFEDDLSADTHDDYYADGKLLVAICSLSASSGGGAAFCDAGTTQTLVSGETFPSSFGSESTTNWVYFRKEVDDGARYFFSPDRQTWVVQTKAGHLLQFGAVLDANTSFGDGREFPNPGSSEAFEASPQENGAVYRWNLARESDASGNTVYYSWTDLKSLAANTAGIAGLKFLSDIYDTPASGSAIAPSSFAHHTHLGWALQEVGGGTVFKVQGPQYGTSPIWKAPPFALLSTVDVTSATWSSTTRQLVRRYTLSYTSNAAATRSFLTSLTLTGTCGTSNPTRENSSGLLPASLSCSSQPPTTFMYYGISGASTASPSVLASTQHAQVMCVPGSTSPTTLSACANGSLVETNSGVSWSCGGNHLVDLNGDGIADFVSTFHYGDEKGCGGTTCLIPCNGDQSGCTVCSSPNDTPAHDTTLVTVFPADSQTNLAPGTSSSAKDGFDNGILGQWGPQPQPGIVWTDGSVAYPNLSASNLTSIPAGSGHDVDLTLGQANFPIISGLNASGSVFDVDGDGLPDLGLGYGLGTTAATGYETAITSRSISGSVRPFAYQRPPGGLCWPDDYTITNLGLLGLTGSPNVDYNVERALTDIDGDGVTDLIVLAKGPSVTGGGNHTHVRMYVLPGRGDGRFGSALGSDAAGHNGQGTCWSDYGVPIVPGSGQSGDQSDAAGTDDIAPQGDSATPGWPMLRFGDLNGDGLADYALVDSSGLSICLRTNSGWDHAHWKCTAVANSKPAGNNHDLEIGDLDGSGIQQVLYADGDKKSAIAYQLSPNSAKGGVRDGLLESIANGRGATTTFQYTTVTNLPAMTNKAVIPVPAWVVTKMTLASLPAGKFGVLGYTNERDYTYDTPVYDSRDRIFAGFNKTVETQPGTLLLAPTVVTTTIFATTSCFDDTSCGKKVDYSFERATRGLPLEKIVGASTATADAQRTDWTEYTGAFLYTSSEGREVLQITPYQEHTYLADSSTTAQVANKSAFTGQTFATLPVVTQPQEIVRRHIFDGFGNETTTIDFGSVQSGTADKPILVSRSWSLPSGDTTGWSYRLTELETSYADPTSLAPTGQMRSLAYGYDAKGRLTSAFGHLDGSLAMQRSNLGGQTASAPGDASQGSFVEFYAITYEDSTGNVLSISLPPDRCESFTYDDKFDQLLASTSVYPSGCGTQAQTTNLQFERGFETLTQSQAPNGALTQMEYDPFGRVAEIDGPGATVGTTTIQTCATYSDSTFSYADYLTMRGDTAATSCSLAKGVGYAEHAKFFDGFGNVVLKFDNATNPSNPLDNSFYVMSDINLRNVLGRAVFSYQPSYISGATFLLAPTFSLSGIPFRSAIRDVLDRVVASSDYNGHSSSFVYHPAALSADIYDAEQNTSQSGASHANGSKITVFLDGHGRKVKTTQYFGSSSKLDTTTDHLATGESTSIVQGSVTRTLVYDTLGRMVSNSEPNSGKWLYAYNDAGELVGTTDPRGCGKNIVHDGLGRVIAEDYSPCDSGQAGYSTPQSYLPTIGTPAQTGYEAVYVYDNSSGSMAGSVGRLTDVYDRAEHEQRSYDGTGRVVKLQRNVIAPDGNSYTPNTFKKSLSYSLDGLVEVASTGADSASLLNPNGLLIPPTGGSAVTATYTLQGTVQSVVSTYGTLLSSQTVDATGAPTHQQFGDAALTAADIAYDAEERVTDYALHRGSGPWAVTLGGSAGTCSSTTGLLSCTQPTLQSVLTHVHITRDLVGNPTAIFETAKSVGGLSIAGVKTSEWPAAALPVSHVKAYSGGTPGPGYVYGDDYRIKEADSIYGGPDITSGTGSDTFVSPYTTAEETANTVASFPLPLTTSVSTRIKKESFTYDLRGNLTASSDDLNDFFDRSLGTVSYSGAGPDQLTGASGISGSSLSTEYDGAGNLKSVEGVGAYQYGWDEVGRLISAKVTIGSGSSANVITEQFAYDAGGRRVITARTDPSDTSNPVYTVNVFDSLVLKGAKFGTSAQSKDYAHTDLTEHLYLGAAGMALGHTFVDTATNSLPRANLLSLVHTYMLFADPTMSTSFVIDHDTSELVERITYQAYGAAESDYRPARWHNFREGRRYTGHDDDAEVGLVYFGERYYSPQLQRWISPDPLAIHGLAGDPNPYAYANNSPIRYHDALGLNGTEGNVQETSPCFIICNNNGQLHFGFNFNININLSDGIGGKTFTAVPGTPGAPPGTGNAPFQLSMPVWQPPSWAATAGMAAFGALRALSPVISQTVTLVEEVATVANPSASTFSRVLAGAAIGVGVLPGLGELAPVAEVGAEGFSAIGSTGTVGEAVLQELGGESQVFFRTSQGGRFVDQLVDGVAHESKVGYQSLTQTLVRQIAKDAELLRTGQVSGYTWHFFESPVTGLGGPSGPLLNQLQGAGIDVALHF